MGDGENQPSPDENPSYQAAATATLQTRVPVSILYKMTPAEILTK